MLYRLLFIFIFFFDFSLSAKNDFISISYHEISANEKGDDLAIEGENYALTEELLALQFQWFQNNGFNPISIDDLLKAQRGEKDLPPNAVLLTFDDGYVSFYEKVFPLLKAFNYPAVLGVVGSWIDVPEGTDVVYEPGKSIKRDKLMTWDQIKEVSQSGLVEIANHSFDMHKGILGNPQGNKEPAYTTHEYFLDLKRYETDNEYTSRIENDLKTNSEIIYKNVGKMPRVMVWPYGATNMVLVSLAKKNGMPITLTLEDDKLNTVKDLSLVGRYIIGSYSKITDFIFDIYYLYHKPIDPFRTVRVDLDYVYDPDPTLQEENVSRLIQRMYEFQISAVILQAYADPMGDGNVKEVYFPNRHLPMRADLFNRVAWQLKTRAGVAVYAWMPMMAFDLGREELLVKAYDPETGELYVDKDRYKRLSSFNPTAQKIIHEIYEDLSKSSPFGGIAYHDDGVFSDFEDANPDAFEDFLSDTGLSVTIDQAIEDPKIRKIWASWKTKKLIELTKSLTKTIRIYNPFVKTMRSMFALPIINPDSEEWFAQNLDSFLRSYDYTAIMAMPYMEGADNPQKWLDHLVSLVKKHPLGLKKSLFELQSVNWRTRQPIDTEELVEWMQNLQIQNAINFGYYPDDFHQNAPDAKKIHVGISKQTYPFRR